MLYRADILLFLNQDVSLSSLRGNPLLAEARSVLAVTTHRLFAFEEEELRRSFDALTVKAQADLFTDAEMREIDEQVSRSLRDAAARNASVLTEIPARYADLMLRKRTAMTLAKLGTMATWRKLVFQPGLGNSVPVLADAGGIPLDDPGTPARRLPLSSRGTGLSSLRSWLAPLKRALCRIAWWLSPQYYPLISTGREAYLFVSSPQRVPLRKDVTTTRRIFLPFLFLSLRQANSMAELRRRFVCRMSESFRIATTIHGYSSELQRLPCDVLVFADGYIPSNYPRTYVDGFGQSVYVCRDPFDCQWFERHGRRVRYPCGIVEYPVMPSRCPVPTVRTVVLALNHAGDWTATIHRSDTDVLVACFCGLAKVFPHLAFVVRTHPSMAHPAHEGHGSRRRLEELLARLRCPNLSLSSRQIEDDIVQGDLFVSEYSNVLYQVYLRGKLGVICNLTKHESYMKDFADLGFACVSSGAELRDVVAKAARSPAELAQTQEAASARFNALFREFFANPDMASCRKPRAADAPSPSRHR